LNLLQALLITAVSVFGSVSLSFYLLWKARDSSSVVWYLEYVFAPLLRVVVLLIVVSQIYPVIDGQSTSIDFWRNLGQRQHLRDIVNILFVVGLLLAFVPLVNHPVFALPIQSMLTIAVVFHWQYRDSADSITLFPSLVTLAKIAAYMLLAWLATRELSIPIARWIDRRFVVSGSLRLVADTIYMLLQIPVMLIYCGYLARQLS
jgi:hypothetical protein